MKRKKFKKTKAPENVERDQSRKNVHFVCCLFVVYRICLPSMSVTYLDNWAKYSINISLDQQGHILPSLTNPKPQ